MSETTVVPVLMSLSESVLLRQEMHATLVAMETRQALVFAELRQDMRNLYSEITLLREVRAGVQARRILIEWIAGVGISIASLFAGSKWFGHSN